MRAFVMGIVALASSAGAVLLPGGGPPRSDCYLEFEVEARELTARVAECTDGDPTCDFDGACDGGCRFNVAVCLNQHDPSLPNCTPPFPPTGLLRVLERGRDQVGLRIPDFASSACGAFVSVDVPATRRKQAGRRVRTIAISPDRPPRDRDVLRLVCRAPSRGCPTTTTTSTTTATSASSTTTSMPSLDVSASADTGIFSGTPDATLGNATQVFVGNDATNSERALLRFDLTSVPTGATVVSCLLQVHVVTLNQAGAGHVYRVKQAAWDETAATWNRYDGVNAWTTPGAFDPVEAMSDVVVTAGAEGPIGYTAPPSGGAFTFPELSALCQDAITNRGGEVDLFVKQDADVPGTTAEFGFSRRTDSVAEERPTLQLVYTP